MKEWAIQGIPFLILTESTPAISRERMVTYGSHYLVGQHLSSEEAEKNGHDLLMYSETSALNEWREKYGDQ